MTKFDAQPIDEKPAAVSLGLAAYIDADLAVIADAQEQGIRYEQELKPMFDQKGVCVNQADLTRQAAAVAAGELVLVTDRATLEKYTRAIEAKAAESAEPPADTRPVVDFTKLSGIDLLKAQQMRDAGEIIPNYGPEKACPNCGAVSLVSKLNGLSGKCPDCGTVVP